MNFKIKHGCSRTSILIFNICIKIPLLVSSNYGIIYKIVTGIQHNIIEYKISKYYDELCPIYFSFLGFINIMPRCKEIEEEEFKILNLTKFETFINSKLVKKKSDSFGYYKNKIVAIDFH